MNEQYGIIQFPEDRAEDEVEDEMLVLETKLKEVIGKSEHDWIVCKEGVFGWLGFTECEYHYYGEFNRNTERIKRVEIFEDRIHMQGDSAFLIKKGNYQILQEEMKDISPEVQIEVLTIKRNYTGELIKLPYSPGIFRIYESDLILADFDDK